MEHIGCHEFVYINDIYKQAYAEVYKQYKVNLKIDNVVDQSLLRLFTKQLAVKCLIKRLVKDQQNQKPLGYWLTIPKLPEHLLEKKPMSLVINGTVNPNILGEYVGVLPKRLYSSIDEIIFVKE